MAKNERFVTISTEGSGLGIKKIIYVDTLTRVQYLYIDGVNGGGLTPLLNAEGKPIIDSSKIR
ncbi:MAG: DUF6440 family protein [Erysipelotrichaceae bacterium]